MLVKQWWKTVEGGRYLSQEEHAAEFRRTGLPIRVVGFKWEIDDASDVLGKDYSPYVANVSLLPNHSGFIVDEPVELAGTACVAVYNADGSERFRLAPTLPAGMFPAFMADGQLVGYEQSRVHNGFAAMFADAGGTRIVELTRKQGNTPGSFFRSAIEYRGRVPAKVSPDGMAYREQVSLKVSARPLGER